MFLTVACMMWYLSKVRGNIKQIFDNIRHFLISSLFLGKVKLSSYFWMCYAIEVNKRTLYSVHVIDMIRHLQYIFFFSYFHGIPSTLSCSCLVHELKCLIDQTMIKSYMYNAYKPINCKMSFEEKLFTRTSIYIWPKIICM